MTKPTATMRAAMAEAEVGDDVYGEDPTVNALQDEVAALFGHEAALFTPTGSMANQIALQLVVPRGEEVLCDADAHILVYELGATAAYAGISSRTWLPAGGDPDPDLIAGLVRPAGPYVVPTRAIAVEQTHNVAGGAVLGLDTLRRLRRVADAAGLAVHCDGARIWHAHVADGVPLRAYGELFDTLSVCLSKGLGAPVGSLVVGSAEKIDRARVIRKRLGGGMRQAGILAAAGRYALRHHIDRLADDHARARRLAEALAPYGLTDPERVRTNIVVVDLTRTGRTSAEVIAEAGEAGVRLGALGARALRLVTHLDVDDDGVDRAVEVLTAALR